MVPELPSHSLRRAVLGAECRALLGLPRKAAPPWLLLGTGPTLRSLAFPEPLHRDGESGRPVSRGVIVPSLSYVNTFYHPADAGCRR